MKAPAAMKMALGENPKLTYNERHETPSTRMATAAIIRENLAKAVEYREKLERAAQDEDEDKPDYDAKLEALLPVINGELPSRSTPTGPMTLPPGIRICQGVWPEVRHRPRHRGTPDPRAAGAGGGRRDHRTLPGGPIQAGAGQHDH